MVNTKESVALKYDDFGIPSIMIKVENTAKTPEEADRMFFVRGVEYDAIYLSRYVNTIRDGRAYSLPMMDPAVMVNMDDAIAACRKKGEKWHLLTAIEWKYIIDHTIKDIHGNTNFGAWHKDEGERGVRKESNYRTLTGSGPASWFHNGNKETGIADVIGLVWKIIAGIRLKNGVLEYMKDNDAAFPGADLSKDSEEFIQVMSDGKPVKIGPGEKGLCITTGDVEGWDATRRSDVVIDLKEIPEILKDLGIISEGMETSEEIFDADAELDEAVCFCSGSFVSPSHAGPSALNLYNPRSHAYGDVGFFSACLGEPVSR